ncbi:shikimate dehydrogenase [Aeromicrobium sp. CF4.19]|uniref:shikimate dehydrogenase n=1 Tax=Aeromicrobium sp. CF4.19 TaxID=3373082 RepID=UPI003EE6C5DE
MTGRTTARRSLLAGLLGQGIGTSLTPELHEREAARHGLRYVYKTIDLPPVRQDRDSLAALLEHALLLGFDGFNVTHPFKQSMVPLVDEHGPEVTAIGALNTIVVRDGRTYGRNTDVTGFGAAFAEGLGDADRGHVVLLGAGGAGTAVAHALLEQGVRHLDVVDPDDVRADALLGSLDRGRDGTAVVRRLPTDALPRAVPDAAGLVNATPVGMAKHPGAPIDTELLSSRTWVADIVYRPLETELLCAAADRGCRTLSGAGMAVHQAADAFELITGRTPDRSAMVADFDDLVERERSTARRA